MRNKNRYENHTSFILVILLILICSCKKNDDEILQPVVYSAISAGDGYSIALKTDGTLWTWGYNADGQLGDGTRTDKSKPVLIGTDYSMIFAGSRHVLALKKNGTLWAWGSNGFGQIGDATTADKKHLLRLDQITLR